jgi:hypothetical protein
MKKQTITKKKEKEKERSKEAGMWEENEKEGRTVKRRKTKIKS